MFQRKPCRIIAIVTNAYQQEKVEGGGVCLKDSLSKGNFVRWRSGIYSERDKCGLESYYPQLIL